MYDTNIGMKEIPVELTNEQLNNLQQQQQNN